MITFATDVLFARTVQEPNEVLDPSHKDLDNWEWVLYVMAFAFTIESMSHGILFTKFSRVTLCMQRHAEGIFFPLLLCPPIRAERSRSYTDSSVSSPGMPSPFGSLPLSLQMRC
jgi:hypothetical protein